MRTFQTLLDEYVQNLVMTDFAASTRAKYASLIRNHIQPAFGEWDVSQLTTRAVQTFLNEKRAAGLSWATRSDLRNLISAIFSTARRWEIFEGRNPARDARAGRRHAVREKRKLAREEIQQLLAALPEDVRLIVMMALFCGLRISEVMGLEWRHIDLARGVVMVRQRFYRGDLDLPKSERAVRDVPLGSLAQALASLYPGASASREFVFSVRTSRGVTRSESCIRRYFLTPAAKSLGIYWPGFGWHTFRREAITAIAGTAGVVQAMRLAGHTHVDVTLLYGLADEEKLGAAVDAFQREIAPDLTR